MRVYWWESLLIYLILSTNSLLIRKSIVEKVDWWESQLMKKSIEEKGQLMKKSTDAKLDWWESWLKKKLIDEEVDFWVSWEFIPYLWKKLVCPSILIKLGVTVVSPVRHTCLSQIFVTHFILATKIESFQKLWRTKVSTLET